MPIKQPLPIPHSCQPLAITNGRETLILSLWICLFRAFHTNKASIFLALSTIWCWCQSKWKSLLKLFHSLPTALRINSKFNAMVHRFLAKQVPDCLCCRSVTLSPPRTMHLHIEHSPLSSLCNTALLWVSRINVGLFHRRPFIRFFYLLGILSWALCMAAFLFRFQIKTHTFKKLSAW